jgi:mannose-6-phosphate isomerase-like protein (cupin superfamily)
MSVDITTQTVDPGQSVETLPSSGPLGGVLVAGGASGKSLVEFVLPDRLGVAPPVPFEASWWTVAPGLQTRTDRHAAVEVWFVAGGRGQMWLGDRELEIRAGQAVYVPSDTPHHVQAAGTDDLVVFSVWWQ